MSQLWIPNPSSPSLLTVSLRLSCLANIFARYNSFKFNPSLQSSDHTTARPYRRRHCYNRGGNGCPGFQCVGHSSRSRRASSRDFADIVHHLFFYLRRRRRAVSNPFRGKHRENMGFYWHRPLCLIWFALPFNPQFYLFIPHFRWVYGPFDKGSVDLNHLGVDRHLYEVDYISSHRGMFHWKAAKGMHAQSLLGAYLHWDWPNPLLEPSTDAIRWQSEDNQASHYHSWQIHSHLRSWYLYSLFCSLYRLSLDPRYFMVIFRKRISTKLSLSFMDVLPRLLAYS